MSLIFIYIIYILSFIDIWFWYQDVSLGLCSLDYSFLNTEDASPSENVQETSTSSFEYKSKVDNWREASELDSDDESVDFDAGKLKMYNKLSK